MWSVVKVCVVHVLSVPSSSACVERILFSQMNIIKTKLTNRLLLWTIGTRLLAKQAIVRQAITCLNWEPSRVLHLHHHHGSATFSPPPGAWCLAQHFTAPPPCILCIQTLINYYLLQAILEKSWIPGVGRSMAGRRVWTRDLDALRQMFPYLTIPRTPRYDDSQPRTPNQTKVIISIPAVNKTRIWALP